MRSSPSSTPGGERISYDPEKSKELLAEAGYQPGEYEVSFVYDASTPEGEAAGREIDRAGRAMEDAERALRTAVRRFVQEHDGPLPGFEGINLSDAERNLLLYSGVSTFVVDAGGEAAVVPMVMSVSMVNEPCLRFAQVASWKGAPPKM